MYMPKENLTSIKFNFSWYFALIFLYVHATSISNFKIPIFYSFYLLFVITKGLLVAVYLSLTPYLTCQFRALPIKQQIKIWCYKYWQMGIQLSDWVENIVGKVEIARHEQFVLFLQCFQKLSVVDVLKWVPVEWRVKHSARIKEETIEMPGSLKCSEYGTVTCDLGLKPHHKDN